MKNDTKLVLSLAGIRHAGVHVASIVEELGEPTHATVETHLPSAVDVQEVLGQEAILVLRSASLELRAWRLEVVEMERVPTDLEGAYPYRIRLASRIHRLTLAQTTRKFRDITARDAIGTVLTAHHCAAEWRIAGVASPNPYIVQWRESDFAFARRTMEREGIYTVSEAGGDHVLLCDDSGSAPEVERGPFGAAFPVTGWDDRHLLGRLLRLKQSARLSFGAVNLRDYDWKRPSLELSSTSHADRDADLEDYRFPGGFREPDEGARLTRIALEAHRAASRQLEGSSTIPALCAGRTFEAISSFAPVAGSHFLVHVEHRYEAGTQSHYENSFRAIPATTPFRLPQSTPRPWVDGCHSALVGSPEGEEIHTDEFARFKARFHWDTEQGPTGVDGRWVRVAQESVTTVALARVGWEMTIAYVDADPERPIGVGRNFNGLNAPSYELPRHRYITTIRTPSSPGAGGLNEIRMDDADESRAISMRTTGDYITEVGRNLRQSVGGSEQRFIAQRSAHVVGDQRIEVAAGQLVETGGDWSIRTGADHALAIGGDESIEASQFDGLVRGDAHESVGGDRTTSAADAEARISRTTDGSFERRVAGAATVAADQSISVRSEASMSIGVGGSMTVNATGGITSTSNAGLARAVGGTFMAKTGDEIGLFTPDGSMRGTMIQLSTEETVELRAKHVLLTADQELSFDVDSLGLALTPEGLELRGPIFLRAATVSFMGYPEDITGG